MRHQTTIDRLKMLELLARMRALEDDHQPDGYPAVKMRDISALCDEIERLSLQLVVVIDGYGNRQDRKRALGTAKRLART